MIAVSGDKYVDLARARYVEVGFAGVSTYQTIEIDPESNRLTYRACTEDDGRLTSSRRTEFFGHEEPGTQIISTGWV